MIFGTAFRHRLRASDARLMISKNLIVSQLARVIAKGRVYVACATNGVDSPEVTSVSFSNVA
jgi:hypothetical protein